MKALVLNAEQKTATVKNIPEPRLAPNEVCVRVEFVALNPVDSLNMFNPLGSTGRVLCSDFAGCIYRIGDEVPNNAGITIGDRVAGFVQGACSINERPGAAADYVVCPWDLVWRIGSGRRLQEAAAVSLCALSAAQALFFRMGLPSPFPWSESAGEEASSSQLSVFIYGATTSVALYAAQLARKSAECSGRQLKLLGTASQKHFGMLKANPYSYDEIIDYRGQKWPEEILKLTDGKGVDYAYDCISEGSTVSNTARTLSSNGSMAIVRSREGGAWTASDLAFEPSHGAVWEGLGENVEYQGMTLPASQDARDFTVAFYKWLSMGNQLETSPVREMPGGLESMNDDGLTLLGSGAMTERNVKSEKTWMKPLSAQKMVYAIPNS
ncbi:hypothetical protein FH972_025520 [Carpinus fangiana]|uniref:Enoyl reductase (ER) domain-containing protein n=1 Tax=Carpinus fangiana TaxID=176857 RepID=A0A5N6L196_9ROSI|nr:hypothetical protein FH972_025520 [Carpinus fangiana]